MSALYQLFLEIEKHAVLRFHSDMILEAKKEFSAFRTIALDFEIAKKRIAELEASKKELLDENEKLCVQLREKQNWNSSDRLANAGRVLSDAMVNFETALEAYRKERSQ